MSGTLSKPVLMRKRAEHFRAIAELDDQIAALEEATAKPAGPYTSTDLPADCPSRERFRRLAAQIAKVDSNGARRVGHTWLVERDAWARHRATTTPTRRTPVRIAQQEPLEDESEVLAQAGLRLVAGAK